MRRVIETQEDPEKTIKGLRASLRQVDGGRKETYEMEARNLHGLV